MHGMEVIMPKRRNNRESQSQNTRHNEGTSNGGLSFRQSVLLAILAAFLGAGAALGADYLKTIVFILDVHDVRVYMLFLTAHKNNFELHLALVNPGNRQGAVSELIFGYSTKMFRGQFYFSPNSPDLTIQGVPALLNPGDMRLVTIKGILPINSIYENGSPVDPAVDGSTFAQGDVHKVDLSLRIRALDFRGQRYEGLWDVGKMSVFPENVAGSRVSSYASAIIHPFL